VLGRTGFWVIIMTQNIIDELREQANSLRKCNRNVDDILDAKVCEKAADVLNQYPKTREGDPVYIGKEIFVLSSPIAVGTVIEIRFGGYMIYREDSGTQWKDGYDPLLNPKYPNWGYSTKEAAMKDHPEYQA
jgi:hypothetical protein